MFGKTKGKKSTVQSVANFFSDCSRFIPNKYFSNYWKDNNLGELLVFIPGQSANLANKAVHVNAYATWNLLDVSGDKSCNQLYRNFCIIS